MKYDPKDFIIDSGPMGPIGEGESLILRTTCNCPWNRCLFCNVYKGRRFRIRKVKDIKQDIEKVKRAEELLVETSGGRISQLSFEKVLKLFNFSSVHEVFALKRTMMNVGNWIFHGKRRVFLQDADSLIMKTDQLEEVLLYLKERFPSVEEFSSYARSKTCFRKSFDELKRLKNAGLSWLLVGIESGSDRVLKFMKKGVTSIEHVEGGKKVVESGIKMAAFIMPGLGGRDLSKEHVDETIKVLNSIKPYEVRIRSLAVLKGSPLFEKFLKGEFQPASEDQMIDEIERIIKGLEFDCIFETLQMTNVLFNIRGKLSLLKKPMLDAISQYKSFSKFERLSFRLRKYLYDGYLNYIEVDPDLLSLIEDAKKAISSKREDAESIVEKAIFEIKSRGIP